MWRLRACSKFSEILAEVRKILKIQETTKIKKCLFGMFSSKCFKKIEKVTFWIFLGKIDVLASSRQCKNTFFKKRETIIWAGQLAPNLELIHEKTDFDGL